MNMSIAKQFLCSALSVAIGTVFLVPHSALAFPQREPEIQVVNPHTREVVDSWLPLDHQSYKGGMDIAVGDLGGDGIDEFIVAESGGEDAEAVVHVYRPDHSKIDSFMAFPNAYTESEVDIAVGDIDGDSKDEIVVSQPRGNRSRIHIYTGDGQFDADTVGRFTAFTHNDDAAFGATIALGNVTGDEKPELIVGTGAGAAPIVRVFSADGTHIGNDIVPFSAETTAGLTVAAVNTTGGEYDDIIIGQMNGGETWIKRYGFQADDADGEGEHAVLAEFPVWTKEHETGVYVDGFDIDGDSTEELLVMPAGDMQPEIRVLTGDGTAIESFEPIQMFEEDFRGGAQPLMLSQDGTPLVMVVPKVQRQRGDLSRGEKYIEVNLTKQTEHLWENGYIRQSYLISSGLPGTPSPEGEFEILKKIERHVYDGRPAYYYPNTPWNLRYKNGAVGSNYYFHTAYWHNNFGTPQSHGCINMKEEDAEFLYNWAEIGTPAWLHT